MSDPDLVALSPEEKLKAIEKIYNLPEFQKFDAPTRRNLLKELEEAERVARIFFPSSQ